MQGETLDLLKNLAHGIATQFGSNCEVVVHDLTTENKESTVVYIENGHVTNRKLGDGPSHVVLEALKKSPEDLQDHLDYMTKTADGKILKSSTVYIRDQGNKVIGIFSINYDITGLLMVENSLQSLIGTKKEKEEEVENIPTNVNDLLDDLLEQSVRLVGKPVALMNKEDKIKALKFLNDAGALLITKASEKLTAYFGISKYTLYSYIDQSSSGPSEKK